MKNQNPQPKFQTKLSRLYSRITLSTVIMVAFTFTAIIASCVMGISFYNRFSSQFEQSIEKENDYVIDQFADNFSSFIRDYMNMSDAICYDVIRDVDFAEQTVAPQLNLLYSTNKTSVESIALFSMEGNLIEVAPASIVKPDVDIVYDDWFTSAVGTPENQHFSMPHIQNIFVNTNNTYNRVITLSRLVNITQNGVSTQAVLLVDIKYSALEEMLGNVRLGEGYLYLTNQKGDIIYHPEEQLILSEIINAKQFNVKGYKDGNYEREIDGKTATLKIKTTGYTGWRIVGVVQSGGAKLSSLKSNLFFVFLFVLFFSAIILINLFISQKITKPINQLEKAVKQLSHGNLEIPIPDRGVFEIRHLESGIRKMVVRIRKLLDDTVNQQQSMRKQEFDVLQSQINPHFLYNTLDIIVWLIENKRHDDAVRAVTALARFFRISLSKGKAIITVQDELEHARNYLLIQEMRYKNKFTYKIDMQPETAELMTVKLILQPLVENAIYHAMEFMDGDGEIYIGSKIQDECLVFEVKDNGQGMPPERARKLENGEIQASKRGSGTGVSNVAKRIRLQYGEGYGLKVYSQPDEGTSIVINIPIIGGEPENA